MNKAELQKIGDSIMLVVPPNCLEQLNWNAGSIVELTVENGALVVASKAQRRYTLEELLQASDPGVAVSGQDREWEDAPPVGRELL